MPESELSGRVDGQLSDESVVSGRMVEAPNSTSFLDCSSSTAGFEPGFPASPANDDNVLMILSGLVAELSSSSCTTNL